MASGDTLLVLLPQANQPPSSNFATLDTRNGHLVLDFDTTTQEAAIFPFLMPRNYAGGNLQVYIHYAASSATSGTAGWDVTLERIGDGSQDTDSDGWATAKTVTAVAVPGTSGHVDIVNVTLTAGATDTDSIAAGERGRLRIRRDVTNDTAAGDLELFGIEVKEA